MKFKIFRFNKVKSTNNTAIRMIKNYDYDFGMILSDLQVNGRGPVSYTHLTLPTIYSV